MKLIRKTLIKDSSGSVTLVPEEGEDMWHLYNLLQKGNVLEAVTFRQFVLESAIGTTEKTTHKINLKATVESLFFDTQATILRVNCRNIAENKYIKIGAYHTIDLELNRPLTISKDEWDSISLERIENACNVANRADLAAVLLQEGIATVCLVTSNMTIVRQKIESTIPKKRRGTSTDYDKGMARFFGQILNAILHHVDFQIVKVLIIASPGFTKDGLYKFLLDQAVKQDLKQIFENKSKIILLHSSSGLLFLKQALSTPLRNCSKILVSRINSQTLNLLKKSMLSIHFIKC
jgi:protein pelota